MKKSLHKPNTYNIKEEDSKVYHFEIIKGDLFRSSDGKEISGARRKIILKQPELRSMLGYYKEIDGRKYLMPGSWRADGSTKIVCVYSPKGHEDIERINDFILKEINQEELPTGNENNDRIAKLEEQINMLLYENEKLKKTKLSTTQKKQSRNQVDKKVEEIESLD